MGETDLVVAGPELDAQMAVEVMGWEAKIYSAPDVNDPLQCHVHLRTIDEWWPWSPSTDWSAAGEVITWLRQQDAGTQRRFYDGLAAQWRQWCEKQEIEGMTEDEWCDIHLMTGTSRWFILYADIPLSICMAALAAVRAAK